MSDAGRSTDVRALTELYLGVPQATRITFLRGMVAGAWLMLLIAALMR